MYALFEYTHAPIQKVPKSLFISEKSKMFELTHEKEPLSDDITFPDILVTLEFVKGSPITPSASSTEHPSVAQL